MPTFDLAALGLSLLNEHKTLTAAAEALAKKIAADTVLRREVAINLLESINRGKRAPKEQHSRRREGRHRRSGGMPSPAQRQGAIDASKELAASIWSHKMRGGSLLGDLRVHELRATSENAAEIAAQFTQRGYDDAVEVYLCVGLSRYCVSADPFAKAREVIKPSIAAQILDGAKISAGALLRNASERLANDLIDAAQEQELPTSPPAATTPPPAGKRGAGKEVRA